MAEAAGAGLRLDLVFRILPGPGNYVTIGNRNSPLRRVPTSTTAAVANAASTNFWESYLADNGAVGTGGDGSAGPGHPSGWDRNRWNSARCDTAETNIFPVEARLANMPALTPGRWASMYLGAGKRTLSWNTTDAAGHRVAAGVYVVKARTAGGIEATRTLVVLR